MKSIEELMCLFESIPIAAEERWSVETIIPNRLHLSKSEEGGFAIFVEGTRASFGAIPHWAGVELSDSIMTIPESRTISALRIHTSRPVSGDRAIAHIAYELQRRIESQGNVSNMDLLAGVGWILSLLGMGEAMLGPERQSGLAGECMLLRRLLGLAARNGIPGNQVLQKWTGPGPAKRDFAAVGVAIEAKATSRATRVHHISSIEQLDPQAPGERVFLFSVGLRRDRSAPKKLPDFIQEVEQALSSHQDEDVGAQDVLLFREKLRQYGYDVADEPLYRGDVGFLPPHLEPALFCETELERVRLTSFRNDALPGMVINVGYELELSTSGIGEREAEEVLSALLRAEPLSVD